MCRFFRRPDHSRSAVSLQELDDLIGRTVDRSAAETEKRMRETFAPLLSPPPLPMGRIALMVPLIGLFMLLFPWAGSQPAARHDAVASINLDFGQWGDLTWAWVSTTDGTTEAPEPILEVHGKGRLVLAGELARGLTQCTGGIGGAPGELLPMSGPADRLSMVNPGAAECRFKPGSFSTVDGAYIRLVNPGLEVHADNLGWNRTSSRPICVRVNGAPSWDTLPSSSIAPSVTREECLDPKTWGTGSGDVYAVLSPERSAIEISERLQWREARIFFSGLVAATIVESLMSIVDAIWHRRRVR